MDSFAWTPDSGSRVLLIDKNDLSVQRFIEVPAGFTFHNATAWDAGSGVVLQLCLYPTAEVMQSGMIELMAAGSSSAYPTYPRARFTTLRLNLETGRTAVEPSDMLLEFPIVDTNVAPGARVTCLDKQCTGPSVRRCCPVA